MELYATELMGSKAYDSEGHYVGKVREVFIEPAEAPNRVSHYLLSRGRFQPLVAKHNQVANVSAGKLELKVSERALELYRPNESWLAMQKDLMDQQIIAGIGNIYSDEILFQARIAPTTGIAKLSPAQLKQLFLETRKVLKTAIECGAGSEQFVERMPRGSLLPERKKGGHCPRCRSPLKICKVGGRTAYCCPHCQNC